MKQKFDEQPTELGARRRGDMIPQELYFSDRSYASDCVKCGEPVFNRPNSKSPTRYECHACSRKYMARQ